MTAPALWLADGLDILLADEEAEIGLGPPAAQPSAAAGGSLGVVKWYNPAKSFGFVTPDTGAWELILQRSVFGQISLSEIGAASGFMCRWNKAPKALRSAPSSWPEVGGSIETTVSNTIGYSPLAHRTRDTDLDAIDPNSREPEATWRIPLPPGASPS